MTQERAPGLPLIFDAAFAKALASLSVAMPAQVTSVNVSGQQPTVDVVTCLGRTIIEDGREANDPPIALAGVPLIFPGSGVYRMTFPIAAGDYVLLVVADRSTDEFVSKGGRNIPAALHSHELTDCFAIPGVIAPPQALTGVATGVMVIGKIDGTPHQPAARKTDAIQIPTTGTITGTATGAVPGSIVITLTAPTAGSITGGSASVEITS